jgi:hypothetical protein
MKVSGKTSSLMSSAAACSINWTVFLIVAALSMKTGAACAAATLNFVSFGAMVVTETARILLGSERVVQGFVCNQQRKDEMTEAAHLMRGFAGPWHAIGGTYFSFRRRPLLLGQILPLAPAHRRF